MLIYGRVLNRVERASEHVLAAKDSNEQFCRGGHSFIEACVYIASAAELAGDESAGLLHSVRVFSGVLLHGHTWSPCSYVKTD